MRCIVSRALVYPIVVAGLIAPVLIAPPPSHAAAAATGFMQAAGAEGWFRQFVELIRKAGIADKLDAGPVTVFMPTNGAFKRLTPKQRQGILALSPDMTRQFVEHYVVPGVALKTKNIDKSVKTMDGASFTLAWVPGNLTLRNPADLPRGKVAAIFRGDIPAGQGVIDAIDGVFIPPAVEAAINAGPGGGGKAPSEAGAAPQSVAGQSGEGSSSAATGPAVAPPPAPAETGSSPAAAVPASPPPATATPSPPVAAPAAAPASTAPTVPSASASKPGESPAGEQNPSQPAEPSAAATPSPSAASIPGAPSPSAPTPAVAPAIKPSPSPVPPRAAPPELSVTARALGGWKVQLSDNGKTGKVDRIAIGLTSGRLVGISARFNTILGFGGKRVFIPWSLVTADLAHRVLKVRMTSAEMKAAPSK